MTMSQTPQTRIALRPASKGPVVATRPASSGAPTPALQAIIADVVVPALVQRWFEQHQSQSRSA